MKFSVGTNWDPELVAGLARIGQVSDVYAKLATDVVGGGRPSYVLPKVSRDEAARHVADCHAAGIDFTYLLNVTCVNGHEFDRAWREDFARLLDDLVGIGVDMVMVAVPYLVSVIKARHPRLKVCISSFAQINSVARAQRFVELGADELTLDFLSIQRDFELMAAIVRSVPVPVQALANHTCLYHCPSRFYHANLSSHASQQQRQDGGAILDYCVLECLDTKLADPFEMIRSLWIRPEDLSHYEEIGIQKIKLVDRVRATDWILKVVEAYVRRKTPNDNLIEVLNAAGSGRLPFADFSQFLAAEAASEDMARSLGALAHHQFLVIDNRELEGFIERVKQVDCQRTDCRDCGICAETATRAVKPNPALPPGIAAQYPHIKQQLRAWLERLYSGEVYQQRAAKSPAGPPAAPRG